MNPVTGGLKINFPGMEVDQLEETCALDVAERGGLTLKEVGDLVSLTRERIRQVEVSAMKKLLVECQKEEARDELSAVSYIFIKSNPFSDD